MADYGDESRKVSQAGLDRTLKATQQAAAKIETGHAGECDGCGEHFARVVERRGGQFCGGCRDKKGLG